MRKTLLVLLITLTAVFGSVVTTGDALEDGQLYYQDGADVASVAGVAPLTNPDYMPGWPITVPCNTGFAPNDNPTLYDLDADGDLEVLVGSTNGKLYIWHHDGTAYTGWPQNCGPYCQSGAAVGDLDGDGTPEIVIFSRGTGNGGKIYAWEPDGTAVSGFPVSLGNHNPSESPSLRDMDGDGDDEILVGVRDYPTAHVYILEGDGTPWSGFPVDLDHVPTGTIATGDLDNDGVLEFVCASYESVYAVEQDGTVMPGWPFTPTGYNYNYSAPVLYDFDGDGDLEICFPVDKLSGNGRFYVLHHDGTVAAGWPKTLRHPCCYGSPALGDVDGDGQMEIVIGDNNNSAQQNHATLYCWNFDGTDVSGFPVDIPQTWQIRGCPIIADLDGDGLPEITANAATSNGGKSFLYAINHDGTVTDGWPIEVDGFTADNMGAVADVDYDGDLDLCHMSYKDGTAYIHLWDLAVAYNPNHIWNPMYHYDHRHTGNPYEIDWNSSVLAADFSAETGRDEGVLLNWRVEATGDELIGVNLYRLDDGWRLLNAAPLVEANGSWLDSKLPAEATMYRLEGLLLDGSKQVLGELLVKPNSSAGRPELSVPYPNPSDGASDVLLTLSTDATVELVLYDLAGRRVETIHSGELTAGRHTVSVDSSTLTDGVYLLRLVTEGSVMTRRLVVAR